MAGDPIEIILLRQWASYIAVPTWITDPDGKLVFFNDSMEPIVGLPLEEADDMPAEDLAERFAMCEVDGTPISNQDRPLMIALTKQMPAHRRIRLLVGETWREVESTAIPLLSEGGQRLGAMATIWEPTGVPTVGGVSTGRSRQYPIEVILVRHWASLMTLPIWVMDPYGTLIYCNRASERLTGIDFAVEGPGPAEPLLNRLNACDLDGTPLPTELQPGFIALTDRIATHREMQMQDRNGDTRRIEVTAIPLIGQGARLLGAMAMFWEVDR
ncbi:MAG TPA: PAS domain-containing protein [Acidimicrobiia bacterium]|nr:PAS domain-containing protein [Acidimicrobiia bacterium]